MSSTDVPRRIVPAQLGFLAIYNPSLGTTDETLDKQIVYYTSGESQKDADRTRSRLDPIAVQNAIREQNNERLRQIGLAQGMVEFGRSFSAGKSVDTVETSKSRILLHELEMGWWLLASINLTVIPAAAKASNAKDKPQGDDTIEYSSREVKPAILLLGDLLRAHSTFLLHHASSLSALFVRTRRSKFVSLLGRYWDMFLSTWNVLMHGNPANNLYGGIKLAACGELGVGVGEEDRGSGEREVLEGFIGRMDGLVDLIVSRFGNTSDQAEAGGVKTERPSVKPNVPWLGSGSEPSAEDGAIFLGSGALSRKSLRNISHWVEDLYRWGPQAYGVMDNPSSNRRMKKSKQTSTGANKGTPSGTKERSTDAHGVHTREKPDYSRRTLRQSSMTTIFPSPIEEEPEPNVDIVPTKRRPSIKRAVSNISHTSTDSDSKSSKLIQYLKLGYGTHWSLGSSSVKDNPVPETHATRQAGGEGFAVSKSPLAASEIPEMSQVKDDTAGHFLIGLLGNIEEDDEDSKLDQADSLNDSDGNDNNRLLLRTLTVELEREQDAKAESEVSIDLGITEHDRASTEPNGSEHTNTSGNSFESQDRNKTHRLRVVVYVSKPFLFVFVFESRTASLALTSLYRSLHYQIGPLIRPLLSSTSYRASKPDLSPGSSDDSSTPIYDLIWDPKLFLIKSTIPNIPDPYRPQSKQIQHEPWSRLEALNTHMQILNTYIASSSDSEDLEKTCKTSRGWWVVWTKIPDADQPTASLASGNVKIPAPIAETRSELPVPPGISDRSRGRAPSRGTSSFGTSLNSGPAHPFLETPSNGTEYVPKDKEIFLIRRASDHIATRTASRFVSGSSISSVDARWISAPGKLAQGIGVDTKRYIEGLLSLR